jgi:hypothetical protein
LYQAREACSHLETDRPTASQAMLPSATRRVPTSDIRARSARDAGMPRSGSPVRYEPGPGR